MQIKNKRENVLVSHYELEKRIEMFLRYDEHFGSLNNKGDLESGEQHIEMIKYIFQQTHYGSGMN